MANQVTILSAVGVTPPFSGVVCDVYGNNCFYVGSGTSFPITFTLPSLYDTAPVLQLTITDSAGCTLSETIYCESQGKPKQFQNLEYFFFMGGDQYYFQ